MSFEFGWKAGQDIMDRARQRRTDKRQNKNDKASRRAANAAASVNRQEARRMELETDALEKGGYYEASPSLSPEQQSEIEAAWQSGDGNKAKALERDYLKEGPMQGQFYKKEKSAIKEGAAKARQAKQEAKKLAQENQHTKKIRSGIDDVGYQQLSDDYLKKSKAEATQKEADANLALAKANDYANNAAIDRGIRKTQAAANLKQAETDLATANLKLNETKKNISRAQAAVVEKSEFEKSARAFNEIMLGGPQEGESFPDFRGRLISHLDKITAYTAGNPVTQSYIAGRRGELFEAFNSHFQEIKSNKEGVAKIKYDDIRAVAEVSIKAKKYGPELEQIRATQGQYGVDGMITRFFIEEDARENGISHLIDPDNVEFQRALKFIQHPTKPHRTHIVEGREETLFNKDTGEPVKNMVLDMGSTLSAWENLKKSTLARYGPSQVQITYGNRAATQGGSSVTFPNESTGPQTVPYDETRIISPSGLNLTGVPKTEWEKFDPATAQETFNFLNGWQLGNPFLAPAPSQSPRSEQPTREQMGPTGIGGEGEGEGSTRYLDPQGTKSMPELPPSQRELMQDAGINAEQAGVLDDLGVDWRNSSIGGVQLIKRELDGLESDIKSGTDELNRLERQLKTGLKDDKNFKPSRLGLGSSNPVLSPSQKASLREKISLGKSELEQMKAQKVKLNYSIRTKDPSGDNSRYKNPSYSDETKKEPSINFKRQQALGRLRKAQYDLGRMSPVGKNGVTKADVKKANELVSKLQKEYDSLSKD